MLGLKCGQTEMRIDLYILYFQQQNATVKLVRENNQIHKLNQQAKKVEKLLLN